MNRYETNLKNTSPVIDDLRNEFARCPRDAHDETHRVSFDASDGYIIPFDYHELVPNSDLYVKYDVSLLSHNPTFRRLLSGASVEIRTYMRKKSDSYKGWNNFITKGRTGKVSKTLPYVDFLLGTASASSTSTKYYCSLTPHSPACYLGFVPPVFFGTNNSNYSNFVKSSYPQFYCSTSKSSPLYDISDFVTGLTGITSIPEIASSTALRISALPFIFYNSIVKEFWDLNLLISDSGAGSFSKWVPENEDNDTILPYEATGACVSSEFDDWNRPHNSTDTSPNVFSITSRPYLNFLHKANKRGDLFDTGSPFPDLLRGDTPTESIVGATVADTLSWDNLSEGSENTLTAYQLLGMFKGTDNELYLGSMLRKAAMGSNTLNVNSVGSSNPDDEGIQFGTSIPGGSTEELINILKRVKLSNNSISNIKFSMNQWRKLATMTVFAERMARTNGSYNEMIKAQFGHNPKWHGHQPIFCGGSRQPIVFSEVVQNSASGDTPLGTTAGRSVSASTNPTISIHTDDYCDVMSVLVIRSDEYYCQGVDKRVSRLTNIEQYFPLFNNLAPDATLNKELYVSGTNATDEDVFNYVERFSYFKSLRNRVSGLLSLPVSKVGSIGQYVKHRIFTSTPNFNIAFSQESEDTNMKSVYTSSVESEYVLSVGISAKLVAPIPSVTRPSDMGISY